MVSFSGNIWIAIKLKILTYQKVQGKCKSDVLQFTCCCACNGTFQQVTVKDYGNWNSAKGRCFMPFSNCAPLFHVIFVLVFCLFTFLLMYYNVACQITATKIYTSPIKMWNHSTYLVIVYWRGILLPSTDFANSWKEAPVWIGLSIFSIISQPTSPSASQL